MRPSTAVDVLNSDNPSFVKLVKELEGEDGVILSRLILTGLINEMLDFFNIGKTMSDKQVAATINLILEDYATLKPDDFKLCFKRAMRGQYGKVYDRIDGELIFEWLEQYLYEKESELEDHRRNENVRLKKSSNFSIGQDQAPDDKAIPMPDYVKESLKKKPAQIKPLEPRKLSSEQILFNGFIKQFDKLWKRNPDRYKGGRFIKRYGKVLNVDEYLNYKALQIERVNKYLVKRQKRNKTAA